MEESSLYLGVIALETLSGSPGDGCILSKGQEVLITGLPSLALLSGPGGRAFTVFLEGTNSVPCITA